MLSTEPTNELDVCQNIQLNLLNYLSHHFVCHKDNRPEWLTLTKVYFGDRESPIMLILYFIYVVFLLYLDNYSGIYVYEL